MPEWKRLIEKAKQKFEIAELSKNSTNKKEIFRQAYLLYQALFEEYGEHLEFDASLYNQYGCCAYYFYDYEAGYNYFSKAIDKDPINKIFRDNLNETQLVFQSISTSIPTTSSKKTLY